MSLNKTRIWCAALLLILISTFAPVQASAQSWKQIIVKCSPEDLARVRAAVPSAIVEAIQGHFLLSVPSSIDVNQIEAIHGKGPIQASENVSVSIEHGTPLPASTTTTARPTAGTPTTWYGSWAKTAYTEQWAIGKIQLKRALSVDPAGGANIKVAVIDTGVDERHPTLKGVISGGKNYVGSSPVPDELFDPAVLAQSTMEVLDQSTMEVLDQSTMEVLDQSTMEVLDSASHLRDFGHGTMMAGLVHLVAPYATIMPFKAFDANGSATEFNIVHAIYDAVDMGAAVINLSFSSTRGSKILAGAVEYAASRGVLVVAAAGNDNSVIPTYAAAYDDVIAVTSVDANDLKASFANYGEYVDLSAPGIGLVSTYPGGRFAIGSGTSGSTGLVSGLFALVKQPGMSASKLRKVVENGTDPLPQSQYKNRLGKGRIDAYGAATSDNNNGH